MNGSVSHSGAMSHRELSDVRPRMAKADVRKADESGDVAWRERVAKAIERTRTLSGLNLNEFADAVERDARQVSRWLKGEERPHLDAILANGKLRQALVVALAEMAGDGIEIETTVRIRRIA